jgi:hypothetical protein
LCRDALEKAVQASAAPHARPSGQKKHSFKDRNARIASSFQRGQATEVDFGDGARQPTADSTSTFAGHHSTRCRHQCCSDVSLLASDHARDVSIRSSTKRVQHPAGQVFRPQFWSITMNVTKFLASSQR